MIYWLEAPLPLDFHSEAFLADVQNYLTVSLPNSTVTVKDDDLRPAVIYRVEWTVPVELIGKSDAEMAAIANPILISAITSALMRASFKMPGAE